MAKPAFIYGFDNLGPERFTELCGTLLGARYRGFGFILVGGIGPDGGVDAELDVNLGIWQPESEEALFNDIIHSGRIVLFQFKHKTVARVGGQVEARKQLLSYYKCRKNYVCELHHQLILQKKPTDYVLVTNVEVNSQFRSKLIEQCKSENPEIEHYQVIGLDELEAWVTSETQLRHLYFPTIFGPPRFDLRINLDEGFVANSYGGFDIDTDSSIDLFQVSVLNVGTVPSFVSSIVFRVIIDGESEYLQILDTGNEWMKLLNPERGTALEPGRKQVHHFPFELLRQIKARGNEVFPVEIIVHDEIGNTYNATIPDHLRNKMLE